MRGEKPPIDEKLDFMKELKIIQLEISKILNKHRTLINNYDNLECNLEKANDKLETILRKLGIQIGFLLDNKEDVE